MKNLAKLGFLAALALVACKNEETETDDHNHDFDHEHHVTYVINEGAFMGNNASISSIDDEGNVEQNLFFTANGSELGDVAQDMIVSNETGYIVLNNSQKVEVVNIDDFTSTATITGLSYPRHVIAENGRVFVTNGSFGGMVYEIDPASNSLIDSVAVGSGPERMAINGTDLLVANSGGWGSDSTISVVSLASLTESQKVEVGPSPQVIAIDANNNIWVLSSGSVEYDENWVVVGGVGSTLVQLSGSDYSVMKTVSLGDYTNRVSKMAVSADGQNIYYLQNGVMKMSITDSSAPTVAFIAETGALAVEINEEGNIVVCTGDYNANGTVKIYDGNGNLVSSHDAGIAPNGIAFE